MISSEVQRTLVKSPPELWAEISDPESLARHLGEFGEIRITRVQPEQKVEWEGDRASGTVVIKPSGWGTKVKLTVIRELALDADDAAARDHGDRPGTVLATPASAPERAPESAPESAPDIGTTAEAEPEARVESAPDAEVAAEPEPAAEQSPPAVETDVSSEPEAAVTAAPAPTVEAEIEPQPEPTAQAELASQPVGRRGFFARLFARRRRGAAPEPPAVPTPEVDRDDAKEPISQEPVAEQPLSDEAVADPPAADEHIADETPAVDLGADEPTVDDTTRGEATGGEATGGATPKGVVPDVPDPEPDHEERVTPAGLEDPADMANESAGGLAGELAAAEEVAAEQVQAVLTGVLDRLGAAHHRPFSRS